MNEESVERRLTTILSADVVGYSRLMGDDEAGTLASLKNLRKALLDPKAAQYHGRTVKLMGDGVLMEFSSVVDAVKYAIEVQYAMREHNQSLPGDRQILFRIGINIGDIIVEDEDIYGQGVNVAARLEGLCDPGGICISRTVYNHIKGNMDIAFEDMGEQTVKNISEPIGVYSIEFDDAASKLVTPLVYPLARKSLTQRHYVLAGVMVALLIGGALAWFKPWAPEFEQASVERMTLPLPDKPSIAVLPFNNFSGDSEQGYFADGMTEDLITDLAKLSGIFVISRNSSWAYKDKTFKVQQVAEDLGVRYVLEGSVQKKGDVLRINAQLIDAIGGHHIWAERYDGMLDSVFTLQDKIIGEIVSALAVNLSANENISLNQDETGNPEAYDSVLQAMAHLQRDSEEEVIKAIELFNHAIDLDPEYSRAYAGLAAAYWRMVRSLWFSTAGGGWESAWDGLTNALDKALAHPSSLAYSISAEILAQQGRHKEAFDHINKATAISPNDANVHLSKAKVLNATGNAEEAEVAARWAMRLDPLYGPDILRALAISLFHQERYEEAVNTIKLVIDRGSAVVEDYSTLAASLGHLGRVDEVPALIEKYNELAIPAYFEAMSVQESGWWWYGDVFTYDQTYIARLQEGLRKGGVPEGAGTDLWRDDYRRYITKSGGEFNVESAIKIDAAEAKSFLDRGDATFIDVRAELEFNDSRVPGAKNLPLANVLSSESLSEIAGKNDNVIFYCHGKHCPYSAYASAKALAWGFSRVYYFAGGFPGWLDAGYEVEVPET
jgi:TolB-like protein/class 3 adenylate cyclase/rhodanese-related sulfurtransferase